MSLLIGETIEFAPTCYSVRKGVVMGEVVMKFQFTDVFPTTGYCVLTSDKGELEHIPYWQVKSMIEPDMAFLELLEKEGDKIEVEYPKYMKPEHPKGWNVQGDGNTDLPFD